MPYFEYDDAVTDYLSKKDKRLGEAIEKIGRVKREVSPDIFDSLVTSIASQQISTKAAVTVCARMREALGGITPQSVCDAGPKTVQGFGMSMRKAEYITELARAVAQGEFDLEGAARLPDDELCASLSSLKGVGVWTAEMLMTFSLQRPDIMSWDDLAIHRGLRMLYRHRKITRELFNRYRRRYSPYASVACLYLWEIAGGVIEGLTDPAPLTAAQKKMRAKKRVKSK